MSSLEELEKRTDQEGKFLLAKRLKEMIDEQEKRIKEYDSKIPSLPEETAKVLMQDYEDTIKTEKELLKKLKIRLSEVDIYEQKVPYRCGTCGEEVCVCTLTPDLF